MSLEAGRFVQGSVRLRTKRLRTNSGKNLSQLRFLFSSVANWSGGVSVGCTAGLVVHWRGPMDDHVISK